MRFVLFTFLLLLTFKVSATHNRGGEITYVHVSGNTYRFTITTCTKTSSPADRNELEINWGDGTTITIVPRTTSTTLPNNAKKNTYVATHTFAGAGTFRVTMEDPNRNGGIINIGGATNSDQYHFCIATEIVISPFLGINNSVQFNDCPCPELACINKRYCYNSQATDPDGDSLSYKLIPCLGNGCTSMNVPAVYQFPDSYGGTFSIDSITGTLCWNSPNRLGEFNIAVLVEEWRSGVKVGSVIRDIQITVDNCINEPPVISSITDTCVVAGDTLLIPVSATDPNLGDIVTLTATGAPISFVSNPASFPSASASPPVSSLFTWKTDCSNIRRSPFLVYFEAEDNGSPVKLSDYKQLRITVRAPSPTGLIAFPLSGKVDLIWDQSSCSNATGYKVYRKKGISTMSYDCCGQSSPTDFGFTYVGKTNSISDTTFQDVYSFAVGEEYCYVITAIFPVDYESCISNEACVKLKKDVPIITHVTVNNTDGVNGVDSIIWAKASDLDTVTNYPPPYFYKVYHKDGFTGANNLIYTSPTYSQLYLSDTVYVHNTINTQGVPNNYKIEMYHIAGGSEVLVGSTNSGSSVYVTTVPNDNVITLNWSENVPWTNVMYRIYKGTTIGGAFTLLDSTTLQTFTDSNLVNGANYCYKIQSVGLYSDPSLVRPIENFSQEICDSPIDLTSPCPPVLSLENSCEDELNYLTWTNPNNSCADDVTRYRLFYSPNRSGPFTEIEFKNSDTDTTFIHNDNGSIAGCYYVTALDSIQYNNESVPSNVVCGDNCPIYFLPNVFTPNGDGINDLFTPLLPYKFIDSVEFIIYNRWGNIVFKTNDPMIKWDGRDMESQKPVSDGVYFYVCRVYSVRLNEYEETRLKGNISIFNNTGSKTN